ncbi:type IV pili methyl-accepting chemotaxis transducer N-terminal domain-containing protein [Cellulophaga baltica]|uniref:PAS domain-containing sensor histidine kinase n=1 Tax=Cellulophaga TaxID=104264 RepID=UPI001C06D4B1|nr:MULTISPECIES: type IV pili methyl-accepting chemotaxis transducer N-terminal domain-containing protein [Cellulophaga]MBU2995843.1 type IV pili methyl-accepting chemotaxis transducer N-terminal domain-containing protein [Cellulophaga baltica]MDO6767238.1 type IV pili methyl-accepting chemotaxis transducer N-terminal domain-containing protein [Cellulophaga sp. 1_MG-2023]
MSEKQFERPLDTTTFLRIQKWYLFAFAAIAMTIIVAQILIQLHINAQLGDSRVINVAGRQRAYSQKLVKEVLLLKQPQLATSEKKQIVSDLKKTIYVWSTSHKALQFGNDSMGLKKEEHKDIQKLFKKITPYHNSMIACATKIINNKDGIESNPNEILKNEKIFLQLMDTIVNEYDEKSKTELQFLKYKEFALFAFSLLILILEIIFIFRPLSFQIKGTIAKLIKSQLKSDTNTEKIQELFQEKEKSLQELQELNFVIDNAALFASAKNDGSIVFISKKFQELLGVNTQDLTKQLSEVLTTNEGQQQYLKEILKNNRKNIRTEEIKINTKKGEGIWLDMSIIPLHQSSKKQSILILCSDITERIQNQAKVEQLKQQNFDDKMLQKKQQASQIVEGQEEERKRIAKDIHDGIGQMLTALKFNIESINLENTAKTAEKIAYLKTLCSDLIKGVRTATFNLTPPELKDHGIIPALHKMAVELAKLTGKNILFENKTEKNIRFDSLAETNIYRVAQEAVNNAIKYAESNYILLSINYTDGLLSVKVDDDGNGFDYTTVDKPPKNNSDGGMGLFYMKERISYINGRLFINTKQGEGTRITINYKTSTNEN